MRSWAGPAAWHTFRLPLRGACPHHGVQAKYATGDFKHTVFDSVDQATFKVRPCCRLSCCLHAPAGWLAALCSLTRAGAAPQAVAHATRQHAAGTMITNTGPLPPPASHPCVWHTHGCWPLHSAWPWGLPDLLPGSALSQVKASQDNVAGVRLPKFEGVKEGADSKLGLIGLGSGGKQIQECRCELLLARGTGHGTTRNSVSYNESARFRVPACSSTPSCGLPVRLFAPCPPAGPPASAGGAGTGSQISHQRVAGGAGPHLATIACGPTGPGLAGAQAAGPCLHEL